MFSPLHGGLTCWDAAQPEVPETKKPEVSKKEAPAKEAPKAEKAAAAPKADKKEDKKEDKKAKEVPVAQVAAAVSAAAAAAPAASGAALVPFKLGEAVIGSSRPWPEPVVSSLSLKERVATCLSVGVECVQPEELEKLLEKKNHPTCYDGFEPSGRMHIAQGILKAINVNKLTSSGCVFVFWVADWFALLNNKMGGDLNKIRKVGEYFIEVWKAAGMDMRNVRFLWASEEINKDPNGYWLRVMDIARKFNITRIKRCGQIMGRGEGDDQPAAQIMYPCMQCADVFYLKADICQLGLDQRKVNMLAREYADEIKQKHKPIILSHGMMPGLLEGQEKMSKSDPDSAIFMEDTAADVTRKIKKAFCPPGVLEGNPCVYYVESLVFPKYGKFEVQRSEQNGGNVTFATVEEFRESFKSGALHPGDLKASLTRYLNEMLEPVRKHFAEDEYAKKLLAQIKAYKVTK